MDWGRVWELFDAALEKPDAERAGWLAEACGADAELRAEVEGLLAGHDRPGVLDQHAITDPGVLAAPRSSGSPSGAVGPYKIVREIGRGGMGVVYLAEDPRQGRRAAIKLLAPHLSTDPQARRRLLAEARAASRLDHPNICEILEVSETDDGLLYLAMPFYEGETVAQRMTDGPLPLEQALRIAMQAAAGLGRAHAAGVVHRDIKPSNLMLAEDGSVKILDFGVAKMHGASLSAPGVRVGTLAYMAPEQLLGEAVSAAADLWALGVTLYEMTAGRRPFQGDYEPAIMYEILNEEPPPTRSIRPELPAGLDRLLGALLEKNAARRLSSAAELCEELEALERGEEIALGPGGPQNLPHPLTTFLGREREIEQLERILDRARLATITGPAGAGKTRLAIEAARRLTARFPSGVWFVSLEAAQGAAQAAALLARALGLEPSPERQVFDQIEDALRAKKTLLVLDNCECILECVPRLARLLEACPELKVLATSRAPLRIAGERELNAPPLEVPSPEAGLADLERNQAVALFLDRARAGLPNFELTAANAASIAELCRRLDGLPLAIELAAARTKLFSPKALLDRLGQRLDLLASPGADRPERHQTLRKAVEWSHELLNPTERKLFRRMSVFRGGCEIECIQAVCGELPEAELLDALDALLQHNLARRTDDGQGESRFDMLETIRELAAERLLANEEADRVRQAHAEHYLTRAETAAAQMTGALQAEALDRFETEIRNCEAAFDWAMERGDAERALRFGLALWRFWLVRGRIEEGSRRLGAALQLAERTVETRLIAKALHAKATLDQNLGDNARATAALERSLALWRELGDDRGLASSLLNQAWVFLELSRLDEAAALSREALTLLERLGDERTQAVAWNNLGWAAAYRGRPRAAFECFDKGLTLRRGSGDRRGEGFALACMAWTELMQGRFAQAHRLMDQATRRLVRIGDRVLSGFALVGRAMILLDEGRLGEAEEIAEKALREWERGGNRSGEAWTRLLQGEIAVERGEPGAAIRTLESARDVWRAIGGAWGDAGTSAALARALAACGRPADARRELAASLRTRLRLDDRRGLAECLEILSGLESAARPGEARHWAALAATLRADCESPRPPRRGDGPILEQAAAAAPPDSAGLRREIERAITGLG